MYSATTTDFSVVEGGPTYRILLQLGLLNRETQTIYRTAIAFALVSWLPLAVLSAIQGLAIGKTVAIPFLYDIAAYTRFLIAVPLLVIAEVVIGAHLAEVASHFISSGLVTEEDYPSFNAAVKDCMKLRDSAVNEGIILLISYASAAILMWVLSPGVSTWRSLPSGSGHAFTLAGWWYALVSIPIFQFLMYRWFFRLLIWSRFLWRMSRLNLRLMPTNPDKAGGLGFIGESQKHFALIAFAFGAVFAGIFGNDVIFGKTPVQTFKTPVIALALLALLTFEGPLLFFAPRLRRVRRKGLLEYGKLSIEYTTEFHEKWIGRKRPMNEPLVGNADIRSLADLGNSFEMIERMRIVPFDLRAIIWLVLCFLLPMLPLLLSVVPLSEIIETLLKLMG
jgi:hypothetical protein